MHPLVQRVVGVVLGGLRRRPHDDEHLLAVESRARRARPGRARSRRGSSPPSGPGSGTACVSLGAGPLHRLDRDRVGHQHPPRGPEGDPALEPGVLVVLHLHRAGSAAARETTAMSTEPWAMREVEVAAAAPSARSRRLRAGERAAPCRSARRRRGRRRSCTGSRAARGCPTVCPYSRAVTTTSWPAASRRSMIGRSTRGCAAAVQSTQTAHRARPGAAGSHRFGDHPCVRRGSRAVPKSAPPAATASTAQTAAAESCG